jgi:hypothetical protein
MNTHLLVNQEQKKYDSYNINRTTLSTRTISVYLVMYSNFFRFSNINVSYNRTKNISRLFFFVGKDNNCFSRTVSLTDNNNKTSLSFFVLCPLLTDMSMLISLVFDNNVLDKERKRHCHTIKKKKKLKKEVGTL